MYICIGTSSFSIDKIIKNELQKYGISKYLLLSKKDAIQTKTRIISSRGSQVFRYDSKFIKYNYSDSIPKIIEFLEKLKNQINFLVISKYYDNFLSPKLIKELLKFCKQNKIKSIVDNRQNNINDFVGIDFYKMNFNEFKNAFNCLECKNELNDIKNIINTSSINFKNILLTRSEKSTILISKNNNKVTYLEIPVHSTKVRDVSGAGDTFVASFSSFYYQYQDDMFKLINFVHQICKIVVSKIGTEVVWKDEINNELNLDDLRSVYYPKYGFDKKLSDDLLKKDQPKVENEEYILNKIKERDEAKKNKDYATADAIREELLKKGIILKDTREGTIYELK